LPGLHREGNGRSVSACTQPAPLRAEVENETPHINKMRRDLVEMLFHEGNHLCPICEASGNCELQAMAYRLDMTEPTRFPYLEPCRAVDASHPDIALDTNRCILRALHPGQSRMSMARASSAMSAGAFTGVSP
jgi:[NiFe] hydrogenase diaphorase moiety small subunit